MSVRKIILKNAFYISLAILSYFFLLRGFHVDNLTFFRIFNLLFITLGINNAIKNNIILNNDYEYFSNFSVGIFTSLFAIAFSTICVLAYINFIQPSFITILHNTFFIWSNDFSLPLIIIIILLQGITITVVSTLIIMQYWKKHTIENND